MSADDVLAAMQQNAIVTARWRQRTGAIPSKLLFKLEYPDGRRIPVQRSTVDPLVYRGLVHEVLRPGGETDFILSRAKT